MSAVFITGVTGFAGTNLVRYLTSLSTVSIVGQTRRLSMAREKFHPLSFPLVDRSSAEILNDFKIDTVVHLAGVAHDLSNTFTDDDYFNVNYEATRTLYNEFLASDATKFIYVSSIKAAVDTAATPVDEDVLAQPVTAYGKSKLKAEEYIRSVKLPPDKSYYIFRPCMIHGPENKGNLNLLYKYVRTGFPWLLGSFHNERSFLSVENFTFIVNQFHQQPIPSGIYHLADDGVLSTNELVQLIASALDKKIRIFNFNGAMLKAAAGMLGQKHRLTKLTESLVVTNAKLNRALQKPLPVSIGEGIKKTIRSFV